MVWVTAVLVVELVKASPFLEELDQHIKRHTYMVVYLIVVIMDNVVRGWLDDLSPLTPMKLWFG